MKGIVPPLTLPYPFNVLAEFLRGIVGVGDSDGDHAADELDACPQFERLAPYEPFTLRSYDGRTMSLALCSTKVLASEPQPRPGRRHAEQHRNVTFVELKEIGGIFTALH